MVNYEIKRLGKMGIEELTEIWNHGWQGYYFDMTFTPVQMQVWLDMGAVSLEHSLALVGGDRVLGFSLLAGDGEEGWIAGTSVAPEVRRQGLFKPLMQAQLAETRKMGIRQVYLEVLTQNHAQKVYQAVGFQKLRQVHLYRLDVVNQARLKACLRSRFGLTSEENYRTGYRFFHKADLAEYLNVRRLNSFKPTWQRRDAGLVRYHNLISAWLGRGDESGFVLAGDEGTVLLDAWCSGPRNAAQVLSEIMARTGKLVLINQPEDWLAAILHSCQIRPQEIQLEMRCD